MGGLVRGPVGVVDEHRVNDLVSDQALQLPHCWAAPHGERVPVGTDYVLGRNPVPFSLSQGKASFFWVSGLMSF